MSFFEQFSRLANGRGLSVNAVAKELKLSSASVTAWKNGTMPNTSALEKLAEYFNVSIDYLLGRTEHKKTPVISERDRRDIADEVKLLMAELDQGGALMFDGDPMSDEAKESMRNAMQLGLEAAKLRNRERFTPKKYK